MKDKVEPQTPEEEARNRAEECNDELNKVLKRFECLIQPYFTTPKNVGSDGDCMQISVSYGVRALPKTPGLNNG